MLHAAAEQAIRAFTEAQPEAKAEDTVIQIVTPIEDAASEPQVDAILFKTPSCPNCKAAMALLELMRDGGEEDGDVS